MSENDSDGSGSRFGFKLVPYYSFRRQISEGLASQIDLTGLAAEIREHGIRQMPAEVVEFLCDQLEGKIERRGRKSVGKTVNKLNATRAAMFYRIVRQAQQNPDEADAELVQFIEDSSRDFPLPIAESETAWRIVSLLVNGNDGHYKRVANLVSEFAPLTDID